MIFRPSQDGAIRVLQFSNKSQDEELTFFCTPEKRIFLFFLWGDPLQNRPQNQALQVAFSLIQRPRSEVPERGAFGEENCLGRVGWTGQTKKKRMRQKGGRIHKCPTAVVEHYGALSVNPHAPKHLSPRCLRESAQNLGAEPKGVFKGLFFTVRGLATRGMGGGGWGGGGGFGGRGFFN